MIWVDMQASGSGRRWTESKNMLVVIRLIQTLLGGSAKGLELLKIAARTLLLSVPLSVALYVDMFYLGL